MDKNTILRYINHQLSFEDTLAFEEAMAKDEELMKEVELMGLMKTNMLFEGDAENKKPGIKDIIENTWNEGTQEAEGGNKMSKVFAAYLNHQMNLEDTMAFEEALAKDEELMKELELYQILKTNILFNGAEIDGVKQKSIHDIIENAWDEGTKELKSKEPKIEELNEENNSIKITGGSLAPKEVVAPTKATSSNKGIVKSLFFAATAVAAIFAIIFISRMGTSALIDPSAAPIAYQVINKTQPFPNALVSEIYGEVGQGAGDDEFTPEQKKQFEKAQKDYQDGNYLAAAQAFDKLYKERKKTELKFFAARAYLQTKDQAHVKKSIAYLSNIQYIHPDLKAEVPLLLGAAYIITNQKEKAQSILTKALNQFAKKEKEIKGLLSEIEKM